MDFEIKNIIHSIKLDNITKQLIKKAHWSTSAAHTAEQQYRNFLFLKKKYGDNYLLPPSIEIDEFWHQHILDTKKYFADCLLLFGKYLHHYPDYSSGIDSKTVANAFTNHTQFLYLKEFGEPIYQIPKFRLWNKTVKRLFKFNFQQ